MPANLPPQYYKLEREFKSERDPAEKLRLARELLALMPKHKGTDKLQAELKAKISKLKEQAEGGGARHGAHRAGAHDHVEREGAAQILLIGPPNSGKSSILDALTNARPTIADFPYTTQEPKAGMVEFETVQFQLVDTPPVSEEHMAAYLPNLVRAADLVAVVVDVSDERCVAGLDVVFRRLGDKRIRLVPRRPQGDADPLHSCKPSLVLAHKYLDLHGQERLPELRAAVPDFTVIPTSILDDASLGAFMAAAFAALNVIRIYTKRAGQQPDYRDPIILPAGSTVADAARSIHKDFARDLQFARIWGEGRHDGQRVKSSFPLQDRDTLEFHL